MRPFATGCVRLLLLACSSAFASITSAGDAQQPSDAHVRAAAEAVMQQYGIAGMAIALTVDGKQRFYNFGVASKQTEQPVTRDTLFEIGSISKTFTATLATLAQANGRLALSDSPSRHLAQLRGSRLDHVTLMHLGTHTAGGFPLQVPEQVHNDQQLMDYFKAWQPEFAVGTQRTYANPSIGLLGVVAAKSMNLPFDVAVQSEVFAKLGMHNSYYDVPPAQMARYAQGYNKEDAPVRLNPGVLAAEAYGVKTSSADLLRFVEANLHLAETETRLQRALDDTRTGYFRLGAMTQSLIWEQYRYPVALETLLQGNSNALAYESKAVTPIDPPEPAQDAMWVNKTGSTNGFGAYVAFVPEKKLGIVVLANKNYPNEARVSLAHGIFSELD
ncbi:class C beta-lactamase [Pseudomonas borbori]